MIKKCSFIISLFLCFVFNSTTNVLASDNAVGQALQKKESGENSHLSHFTIKPEILTLLDLSNKDPQKAEKITLKYMHTIAEENIAEQYLFLLVQAKIKQHNNEHLQVIELLEQAKELGKNINNKQLHLPIFADLYQVLSDSLVATEKFEKAYLAKQTYIDKFIDYSDEKRDKTIAMLTKKHELAHKIEVNELLDNQNKLKNLRLRDVKRQQENLQRNFLLILSGLLFFVLLLWRQFRVRKKLILLSRIDSLTGLLNRTSLFVKGLDLVKKVNEENHDLSVLLFDIDHLKIINDKYGHHIGDLVLVEISKLVNESMRDRDYLARLGGEEFVVLLPNTDIDKAKAIAVRIVEKIAHHSFHPVGVNQQVTLSIGVANINDTNTDFDDILHAADLAMYRAKTKGRNQMVNYATIAEDQERRAN